MNKIQCEILGLSSSPSTGGAYAILLKEVNGSRRLPIIIGAFEAQAIALEIEGIKPPRPLTHDLLKSIVDNIGALVVEVVIDELRENTFYAKIILEVSTLTNEIDARPSDAIALAAFIPSEEPGKEDYTPSQREEEQPIANSKEAKIAALQSKLREAIESEEYERAARLRDDIQRLTNNN